MLQNPSPLPPSTGSRCPELPFGRAVAALFACEFNAQNASTADLPRKGAPGSSPVVGAIDGRNVALHRILQDLFRIGMYYPLEMVAVDSIEREGHQRRPDGTNRLLGKGDMVRNAAHERE